MRWTYEELERQHLALGRDWVTLQARCEHLQDRYHIQRRWTLLAAGLAFILGVAIR